jgi:hypothetical protein
MEMKRLLALWFCWAGLTAALPAQYAAIDRHAAKAPDSLAEDLSALAAYLVATAQTEAEKARSLYAWVLQHLSYDQAASKRGRRINHSVEDILRRRRGTCFDYAKLYEALCREAGLEGRFISGYARSKLDAPVRLREPDHAWNAVRLDGEWHLLDATWGDGGGPDEWMARYGRSYFLAPPELFVLNHLPANPIWQLLDCPLDTSWFHRPASSLAAHRAPDKPCLAFRDSIAALLALPKPEQREREAQAAYLFYPTAENRREWGQTLVERAVALDEGSAALPLAARMDAQAQAIALCEQAAALDPLFDWQLEFFIGLLINQAVAYNQLDAPDAQPELGRAYLEASRDLLRRAQSLLPSLPAQRLFRQYAEAQCEQFLEAVEFNLERH